MCCGLKPCSSRVYHALIPSVFCFLCFINFPALLSFPPLYALSKRYILPVSSFSVFIYSLSYCLGSLLPLIFSPRLSLFVFSLVLLLNLPTSHSFFLLILLLFTRFAAYSFLFSLVILLTLFSSHFFFSFSEGLFLVLTLLLTFSSHPSSNFLFLSLVSSLFCLLPLCSSFSTSQSFSFTLPKLHSFTVSLGHPFFFSISPIFCPARL